MGRRMRRIRAADQRLEATQAPVHVGTYVEAPEYAVEILGAAFGSRDGKCIAPDT